MLLDVAIILGLILLNGVFAMTELAVVSSRKARLVARAEAGSRGARLALELKEDPSKFLSTVQIGITLIGIFSGAYSGVTVAEPLGEAIGHAFPSLAGQAEDIAFVLVVTCLTYLSLVVGELVPKQIALKFADDVAVLIAPPIRVLSGLTKPIVTILDLSNRALLSLLRVRAEDGQTTSQEDVKAIIAEGTAAGVLDKQEQRMLESVLNLDAVPVRAVMTHRQDMVFFDADAALPSILAKIEEHRHSNYPLCEGPNQHILGIVSMKDLVLHLQVSKEPDLRRIATQPLTLPEGTPLGKALESFRAAKAHVAVIVDEYGSLEGVLTLKDIMEAIVGVFPEHTGEPYHIIRRHDGSWLVDGMIPVYEVETALGIKNMLVGGENYTRLAGFVLHHLGRIPEEGAMLNWNGWRLEVVDMDGKRIDKVLIQQIGDSEAASQESPEPDPTRN